MRRLLLAFVLTLSLFGHSVSAATIGVVDGEKIFDEYPAAQTASKEIAAAQEDLRNIITDSEKSFTEFEKLKKSDAEKATKQKELQTKIDAKAKSTKEMIEKLSEKLEKDIVDAIGKVAAQKGVEVVLDKRAVLTGGIELTDEVSNLLKGSTPLAKKK